MTAVSPTMTEPREFVIDLFCGAGGTSEGVHLAEGNSKVIGCVNHDDIALLSHSMNHPWAKHMCEDIRNPEVLFFLKLRVDALRKLHPGCIITIWASLECTNFSIAKGGLPRDADSRTLANYLLDYIDWIDPDFLMIENVAEFMSWGPLDKKGKPVSRKKGVDYIKWRESIKDIGYKFDYRILNAADFGAYTSRKRYFAQFAKHHLPICWPESTHSKDPEKTRSLFGQPLKKWMAVKDVLDLDAEGKSIFNRKKDLVDNTLKRIYAGLLKFVGNGDESFLQKNFSGDPNDKVTSCEAPCGSMTTTNAPAFVQAEFLVKYNSTNQKGKYKAPSVEDPCPTVATQGRLALSKVHFLESHYGNGHPHSVSEPCPTVSTKDRFGSIQCVVMSYGDDKNIRSTQSPAGTITTNDHHNLVDVKFMMLNFSSGGNKKSIDSPAGSIMPSDKHNLITANTWLMPTSFANEPRPLNEPSPVILASRKHHYIINPQYSSKGASIEKPCPVIIARQDKLPLGLIICERSDHFAIPVYESDTEIMVKIKMFMAAHGIVDIKMRMLLVEELLRIQGFPEGYVLKGTKTQQKKFIGNSVEVTTAKKIFEAHFNSIREWWESQNIAA